MDYSKLMESSRPFSAYEELSGGVNAWGLGGMGLVKRGGFGSAGALGTVSNGPLGLADVIKDPPNGAFRRYLSEGDTSHPRSIQGAAIDEIGRDIYSIHRYTNTGTDYTVVSRSWFDGPSDGAYLDWQNASELLGHQGISVEKPSGGGTKLWCQGPFTPQAGVDQTYAVRFDYTANGAPANVQNFKLFPDGWTNVTPSISYDGLWLIAIGYSSPTYRVRIFSLATLIAGGAGNYDGLQTQDWSFAEWSGDGFYGNATSDGTYVYIYGGDNTLLPNWLQKRTMGGALLQENRNVLTGYNLATGTVFEGEGSFIARYGDPAGTPSLGLITATGTSGAPVKMLHTIGKGDVAAAAYVPSVPAYTAAVAAFTTPPSVARSALLKDCIRWLVSTSAWAKLDALYLTAGADSQCITINLKNPGSYTLVKHGTPTFTADQGVTGVASGDYYDTQFNPTTAAGGFVQDSCHMGIYTLSDVAESMFACGMTNATITPRSASNNFSTRAADGTTNSTAVTSGKGSFGFSRSAAGSYKKLLDGRLLATQTQASIALSSRTFWLGGWNAASPQYSTARLGAYWFGSALTEEEWFKVSDVVRYYLTQVGAV